jgi:predicted chitinase
MRLLELFDTQASATDQSNSVDAGTPVVVNTSPSKNEKGNGANSVFHRELDAQGIKDPYIRNAIIGKFGQESGSRTGSVEVPYTNTANDRIRLKLPQFSNMGDDELNTLKADPKAFFNRAYGGVLDNTGPNDGWLYRGRGLTGITGKSNYAAVDKALGLNGALVKNPDLLLDPDIDRRSAVWYYKNAGADKASFKSQDEANAWAIYKAGGQAYAPGTKLGNIALADLQKKTSGSNLGTGNVQAIANNVVDTVKSGVKTAKTGVQDFVGSIPNYVNDFMGTTPTFSKFDSASNDTDTEEEKKKKRKKKLAMLGLQDKDAENGAA